MAERKNWLETVLKKKNFNESPLEVISVEDASSVVGKGENYLSQIERVRATVLLGSGQTKKISLIIKNQHETEQMKKLSLELGVFFREITMYRDILPKMEALLDEINDTEGIIWGRCFDYRLYDRIVFEDLGASGYKMADRKKQLGLESALLVVKNLAKFHALSKILLDRGEIPLDVFGKHIWSKSPEMTNKMITENGERLIAVMKTWGDEWQEAADRFQKAIPDFGKRFVEELEAKPDEFNVLAHGDCWTNNMLFKGDDLEKPTSVKLIDFQTCCIASPAYDVHLFVGSSVRQEVIENHYEELIQEYCSSLRSYLTALRYTGPVPGAEEMRKTLAKKCVLRMGWIAVMAKIVAGDADSEEGDPGFEKDLQKMKDAADRGEEPTDVSNPFEHLNERTVHLYKSSVKECLKCGSI